MTHDSDQYRAALDQLGLTQAMAAKFLGISLRTSSRYATGQAEIPLAIKRLLQLMQEAKQQEGE